MRPLSLTMRQAANAEETGQVLAFLITIEHDDLADPIRISSDPTGLLSSSPLLYGTVSRGDTFNFLPLTLKLPDDADDAPPAMQLVLDNVGREAIPLLRSVSTPARVSVELVLASAPDDVEAAWPEFDLVNVSYDAGQITLQLTVNALVNEPFPAGTFTPGAFGGLF